MTEHGVPSITCPRCGMTSFHPTDIQYGWCGNCHAYTGADHTARPIVAPLSCSDGRHATVITDRRRWRDGFHLTFWVRCWDCDLADGPYPNADLAREQANKLAGIRGIR